MGHYTDNCENSYTEGYDDGRDVGYSEGYDVGISDAKSHMDDVIETSIKQTRNEMEYEMDVQREAFQRLIFELMSKIKQLNKDIYELRKDNATITRSIQQNTDLRN